MERVMIFIDGNNFYHCTKNYLKQAPKLDFQLLNEFLVAKRPNRHLLRTYFYTVNDPVQQGLVTVLSHIPRFEVVLGSLMKLPIPGIPFNPNDPNSYVSSEKGTDVNLTTNLLIGAYMNSYDTAIVISADTDYKTPIQEVRKLGKIVELVIPKSTMSDLRRNVDQVFELEEQDYRSIWRGTYSSRIQHPANVL